MGISLREFWVAMDMLGTAKLSTTDHRFEDGKVSYFVNGQEFVHSGSQYVYMPKGDKITKEFKKKVLQEFNLTQPNDEKNLVVGGICSVEALLTIALMLEGRYSKELVETLTNKTYQRIFEVFKVKEFNVTCDVQLPEMEQLRNLLKKYDSLVNPLNNSNYNFKAPSEMFENIDKKVIDYELPYDRELCLSVYDDFGFETCTMFQTFSEGQFYNCEFELDELETLRIKHYYYAKCNSCVTNEVISVYYEEGGLFGIIDVAISLKTGRILWGVPGREGLVAKKEDLMIIVGYLNLAMKMIERDIISEMTV